MEIIKKTYKESTFYKVNSKMSSKKLKTSNTSFFSKTPKIKEVKLKEIKPLKSDTEGPILRCEVKGILTQEHITERRNYFINAFPTD